MKSTYALVDCNNFYAACERLFRPDLARRPVIVLSNNDGCVVARSPEAKALGLKMGVPVHQIRGLIRAHNIAVFSSNYTLYGDLSHRVMSTLERLAPRVEVYSIDEAFLDLTGLESVMSFEAFGRQVRECIGHDIGLPVCVGIAPTRTLAKLANYGAKHYPATKGVVDLTSPERQRRLMTLTPVDEVWGVGSRLKRKLNDLGIHSALDLARADPALIRKRFSVVLERTARELCGQACLPFEDIPATKQQIMCSRSFGQSVSDEHALNEAVAHFLERACAKLRGSNKAAQHIQVFIRTNAFRADAPQYANSASRRLITPTDDTTTLLREALSMVSTLYRPGYDYAKAGVMLSEFSDAGAQQEDLFSAQPTTPRSPALMQVVDSINERRGMAVHFARSQGDQRWQMRRNHLSPAYTTRWSDLPQVR